jgi:putative membrane protein
VDAVVVGVRIISLGLTKEPILSGIGFVLAGLGGVFAVPFLKWFKGNKVLRTLSAVVVLVTALVWAVTFYTSLWGHMASFSSWVPTTMAK